MPNDPARATFAGSDEDIAQKIMARRASGNAPKPDGPPPDGLVDADDGSDYQPSQNLHVDNEADDRDETPDVSREQLRKEALGLDDQDPGEDDQVEEPADDDDQEIDAAAIEDEPTDADAEDQGVELSFETIDELSEALGLEVDDFLGRVKIKTVVDGEVGEITLADLRKGHQLESSFTRKNQAFVARQKAFEEKSEAQRAQIADHFQKSAAVLDLAQRELNAEYQGIDWNALQASNPGEFAAKRQQFGERQARLNRVMQQTTQQIQQAQQAQEQQDSEARDRHLDEQHDLLMDAVPAWRKSEELRAKEGTQIAEYLATMGYTPEELNDLSDHRLILLGRAALGLQGPSKRKLELAKKKVKQVKNLVKPGNSDQRRKQGSQATLKKAQSAKADLKKSGTTEALQAALLARRTHRDASQKRGRRSRI